MAFKITLKEKNALKKIQAKKDFGRKIGRNKETKTDLKSNILIALRFVALLIVFFLLIYFGGIYVMGWPALELLHAHLSNGILGAMGNEGTILVVGENVRMVFGTQLTAEINELCSGWLETAILLAAILSTIEISWRKRLLGVVLGLIVWLVINPIRIAVSVMNLLYTSIEWAELTHDVFFRVSLFVIIALTYMVWLKWAKKN